MDKTQKIITYLAAFTILLYIFRFFGIIRIDGGEILGYAFIFYGISAVYLSFGQGERYILSLGTAFFCLGLFLFMIKNFHFYEFGKLIIPAALMTFSVTSLILFLDSPGKKIFLRVSVGLFLVTLIIAKIWGYLSFGSFFTSAWATLGGYWPVALIFLFILFLLRDSDF